MRATLRPSCTASLTMMIKEGALPLEQPVDAPEFYNRMLDQVLGPPDD